MNENEEKIYTLLSMEKLKSFSNFYLDLSLSHFQKLS